MNDLTRRQLEMERRVYRLEDLVEKELSRSNAATMAAEYLGNVLTLEWARPPWFTGYPTTPGTCYGGPASTPAVPSWPTLNRSLFTSSGPTVPPAQGCGWANYYGLATPKDPALVWKYVVYMTYKGVRSEVLSYTLTCTGWVVNPGPVSIPNLNADDYVVFDWEYVLASEVSAVMSETISSTSNFQWFDSSNTPTGAMRFIGASITMTTTSSISGSDGPLYYGSNPGSGCTVGSTSYFNTPGKAAITLTGSISNINTLATVNAKGTLKLTGLSLSIGAGYSGTQADLDNAQLALLPFVGDSISFGNNGDQCTAFNFNGDGSSVTHSIVDPVNVVMEGTKVIGAVVTGLGGGRWAKSTDMVGITSCESPPTIYKALPPTVSVGRASTGGDVIANGWRIAFKSVLNPANGFINNISYGGAGAKVTVPAGPISPGYKITFTDYQGYTNADGSPRYNFASVGSRTIRAVGTWELTFS